jgi:hypothetical protein
MQPISAPGLRGRLSLAVALIALVGGGSLLSVPRRLDPVPLAAPSGPAWVAPAAPRLEPPSLRSSASPTRRDRTPRVRRTIWDLDEIFIGLSATGPAPRFDPGEPREAQDVEAALRERDDLLRRCHRWARLRDPSLDHASVGLTLQIDEWGRTKTAIAGQADLVACVDEVLRGLELDRYTPRMTRATGVLSFVAASSARSHAVATRPRAPRLRSPIPALSVRQPVSLPADELRFGAHEIFDGGDEPMLATCSLSCGCFFRTSPLLQREISRHYGALGRCYRSAFARRPGLSGQITIQAVVSAAGQPIGPVLVAASTIDDPSMQSCVTDAFADLRLPVVPWKEGETTLSIPFHFVADDTSVVEDPPPATACASQASSLREAARSSRVLDDELVEGARALAALAAVDPGCTASAAELLRELAIEAHKDGQRRGRRRPIAIAVELYRLYVELVPLDVPTRFYLAEALFKLGRHAEATPQYLLVAGLAPLGKYAGEALYAAWVALLQASTMTAAP